MDRFVYVLSFVSALGCGLIAGVFFAFSAFIMKALARLPPAQGIAAMQSINVAVLNPWFLTAFLGTAGSCAVVAVLALFRWEKPGSVFLFAGSVLYLVGTFLVTIIFNVPRNDALARADPETPDGLRLWGRYLPAWTAWNHVRTAAALAGEASLILAICISP